MPKHSNPTTLGDHRRFIRQEVAAERWDVSVDTIRRLIAAGKLTGYRLNGRVIRVDLAEVDACFKPIPSVRQAG
jgi:excisionase family DNA binding protein